MPDNKRPVLPLTGGCACGAIRYEISALPLSLYACHCTDCQRKSGSAFALNMPVRTADFRIMQGQPKGWRDVGGPSGVMTTSWFCGDCSTRLYGERDGRPETMTIRAGSLDDTSWLQPAAHFFMRSAQPWETIADDVEKFDTVPTDLRAVNAAWRAQMSGDAP